MMSTPDRKSHWNKIYKKYQPSEVSWYQQKPSTSLELIKELNLPLSTKIFDNGGGNSTFTDSLLEMGFVNITVSDISEAAIEKAKLRLGKDAGKIKWIAADEANLNLTEQYDLWHDRAAFHFLTDETEINSYVETVSRCVKPGGYFIVGTFSDKGPEKCSGLDITQYSEKTMSETFGKDFELEKYIYTDHITPSGIAQNFIFCRFKRHLS